MLCKFTPRDRRRKLFRLTVRLSFASPANTKRSSDACETNSDEEKHDR